MDKAVKVTDNSIDNSSSTLTVDENFSRTRPQASVATWLAFNTPAVIRTIAPGMSATVSVNGAGSQRTALSWNGFRIQNSSLGLTDFSLIPLSFFDDITLQSGSDVVKKGSGAIGGSINLKNIATIDTIFTLDAAIDGGSFFNIGGNINLSYPIFKNFSGATKYLGSFAKNNFTFTDVSLVGFPEAKRQNAAFVQHQAMQNFNLQLAENHILQSSTWFTYFKRHIPAAIGAGNDSAMQLDKIWRSTISYEGNLAPFSFSAGIAYVHQLLRYKTIFLNSPTKFSTFKSRFGLRYQCLSNLHFQLKGRLKHITADVDNYNGKITELRSTIALNSAYQPHKILTLQFGGRVQFVERFHAQWAIAGGANVLIINRKNWQLHFEANGEQFFRIPTLNDRYWQPGGNQSLQPETGWQTEIGVPLKWQNGAFKIETSVLAFYAPIKNYILWQPQPQGYWAPENYKKVITAGTNIHFKMAWQPNKSWQLQVKTLYAYTSAKNSKNSPNAGQPVIYVPKHKANARLRLQWKGLFISPSIHFTGPRYILADNTQHLPTFYLLNCSAGYTWTPQNFTVTLYLRAQNITNHKYQKIYRQPMPGWQLYGGISLSYRKKNF